MKKLLLTIFALLSLNLAVFAYSETDFMNDYASISTFAKQAENYLLQAQQSYDNLYTLCDNLRKKAIPMYQYLVAENINPGDMKNDLLDMIASSYSFQASVDIGLYKNPDKAASEYMAAVQEYCKAGNYTKAETMITEIIKIPGLDKTKLADCYKVRAQIWQKLNNTTGAQEDYKKYNELMGK